MQSSADRFAAVSEADRLCLQEVRERVQKRLQALEKKAAELEPEKPKGKKKTKAEPVQKTAESKKKKPIKK